MPKSFYLDSCIWRDYYEDRFDGFKPLGQLALIFLNNILQKKCFILYSGMIIDELRIKYDLSSIMRMFEIADKMGLLVKVSISGLQAKEAALLCRQRNVAFGDALHAILARDNNAMLITRDKHFLQLKDIVEARKPEELV